MIRKSKNTSIYFKNGAKFAGDTVEAFTFKGAQRILNRTGRGYMKIDGKLVQEIPISGKELKDIIINTLQNKR